MIFRYSITFHLIIITGMINIFWHNLNLENKISFCSIINSKPIMYKYTVYVIAEKFFIA